MLAGIDVEVLGRHHVGVVGTAGKQFGDAAGDLGAAGHRQRTALAEVVLNVDDDQRPHDGIRYPPNNRYSPVNV